MLILSIELSPAPRTSRFLHVDTQASHPPSTAILIFAFLPTYRLTILDLLSSPHLAFLPRVDNDSLIYRPHVVCGPPTLTC